MKSLKTLYRITMVFIAICIGFNIYRIFRPHYNGAFYTIVNTVTPVVAMTYFMLTLYRRNNISKKRNEHINKSLDKN